MPEDKTRNGARSGFAVEIPNKKTIIYTIKKNNFQKKKLGLVLPPTLKQKQNPKKVPIYRAFQT